MRKMNVAVVGLLISHQAWAIPTLYPENGHELNKIVNNTRSSVIADTENLKVGYILPPLAGTAESQSFKGASANLGFCQNLAAIQASSREVAKKIDELNIKSFELNPVVESKQKAFAEAREAAATLVAANTDLQRVEMLTDRVSEIERRVDEINKSMINCTGAACELMEKEVREIQEERKNAVRELSELRAKIREEYRIYARAKAVEESRRADYEEVKELYDGFIAKAMNYQNNLLMMYREFGKLEGGFVDIFYNSNWEEDTLKLKKQNPDYQLEKIATYNAVVHATFIAAGGRDNYLQSIPSILDYSVNGMSYVPGNVEPDKTLPAFPEQMQASLRLSLVGGCPMIHPEKYDIPKGSNGLPAFAISVAYEYPVASRMRADFKYNMYKFYSFMQERGSKGGFFSRRSWNHVKEEMSDKETFEAVWNESDPTNVLTHEEKRAIEEEVKEELIQRALKLFATPLHDGNKSLAGAPGLPQSGAMVLANGLSKTCGFVSYWCTGGAWILKGLNAIFGSSKTLETIEKKYNAVVTEKWDRTSPRLKSAVTVFASEEK